MFRPLLGLVFAVSLLSSCGDGISIHGTPEYQARKAEEDRKAAEGEKSLFARFDEFATMKAPLKPGKMDAVSSGSIVVLQRRHGGGEWQMEGWVTEPNGERRRCLESAGCGSTTYGITNDKFRATSAEAAKTLIRVACDKGAAVRDFQKGIVTGTIYASDCLVEVFDLRSNSMLGSKRIKSDKVEELGKSGVLDSTAILQTGNGDAMVNPYPAIRLYVKQFGLV